MGTLLNSFDTLNSQAQGQGPWSRVVLSRISATTAATTTSGYQTGSKLSAISVVVPTMGASVGGAYPSYCPMTNDNATATIIPCLDYLMGTLTISTNTFSAGSSMPTKSIKGQGSAIQTISAMTVLVVTAVMTATTPAITITYTDQDDNTSQTATLTLPTNSAANSCFLVDPHLANADSGIKAVTNMSTSAGTAGTLKIYGTLPFAMSQNQTAGATSHTPPLSAPYPSYMATAGETIGFYNFGSTSALDLVGILTLEPDTL